MQKRAVVKELVGKVKLSVKKAKILKTNDLQRKYSKRFLNSITETMSVDGPQ